MQIDCHKINVSNNSTVILNKKMPLDGIIEIFISTVYM